MSREQLAAIAARVRWMSGRKMTLSSAKILAFMKFGRWHSALHVFA